MIEANPRADYSMVLNGELTVQTARRWFDQTPSFATPMHIDLTAVNEVDSAGLALLVHWSNLAASASSKLTFIGVPTQLRVIAKIIDLEEIFDE